MGRTGKAMLGGVAVLLLLQGGCAQMGQMQSEYFMTFFVTSKGMGRGADFGGLAGADGHCTSLAPKQGAGQRVWRAYLSTNADRNAPTQHARERIGPGPWQNFKGVVIARNVDELHGNNNINKQTALNEKGEIVNGAGDTPNMHDILTGSLPNGMAYTGPDDRTCGNWTRSSDAGSAIVGHHDRTGLRDDDASRSWNSSHPTKGCSDAALRSTGGAGLIYCFAVN